MEDIVCSFSYSQPAISDNPKIWLLNSKKIAPVLALASSLVIFLMFTGLNVTTWPNAKITQSDILVKSSVLKNMGDDHVTLLIGIWIALLVFGGYLLAHIHFRVLKEETK